MFLLEYGVFVAKLLTGVTIIVIAIVFVISIIMTKRRKEESYIQIESINEKFEDLQDSLEAEILDKAEYKKLLKLRKKDQKLKEKSQKRSIKTATTEKELVNSITERKMFVINFLGDLEASATEHLREEISAILTVATPKDQVLVKLESCGGLVHNYGLAAAQLQRVKQHKIELVVVVDLVAASGGYMMACVADRIIVAPFAVLGSIGVLAQLPNFNKLLHRYDIEIEHHTSGEYKSTLTMLGKNTDKGREKFVRELEETHKLFKEFVKQYRATLDLPKISTGEYWYGTQAIDLKLADLIQTSDDYLLEKSKEYKIYTVEFKIQKSLKDKLHGILSQTVNMLLQKLTKQSPAMVS